MPGVPQDAQYTTSRTTKTAFCPHNQMSSLPYSIMPTFKFCVLSILEQTIRENIPMPKCMRDRKTIYQM